MYGGGEEMFTRFVSHFKMFEKKCCSLYGFTFLSICRVAIGFFLFKKMNILTNLFLEFSPGYMFFVNIEMKYNFIFAISFGNLNYMFAHICNINKLILICCAFITFNKTSRICVKKKEFANFIKFIKNAKFGEMVSLMVINYKRIYF